MAIFHLSVKTISRAAGRSATAAAAYRAGDVVADAGSGKVFDYRRKRGVVAAELILPGGGSESRADFWNRLEAHHKRGDAVLSREVEVALPAELSPLERHALARTFAQELAQRYGVAADMALHEPGGRGDSRNWHCHIMLSACHVQPDGTLGKKAVELDPIACKRAKVETMADAVRVRWALMANAALELAGCQERIDHRSNAERGIEAAPAVHLGPAATGFERRTGEASRRREEATPRKSKKVRELEAAQQEEARAAAAARVHDLTRELDAALAEREQIQREERAPAISLLKAAFESRGLLTARNPTPPPVAPPSGGTQGGAAPRG